MHLERLSQASGHLRAENLQQPGVSAKAAEWHSTACGLGAGLQLLGEITLKRWKVDPRTIEAGHWKSYTKGLGYSEKGKTSKCQSVGRN